MELLCHRIAFIEGLSDIINGSRRDSKLFEAKMGNFICRIFRYTVNGKNPNRVNC